MTSLEKANLKVECLKLVFEEYNMQNKSVEFLLEKATDLFNWVCG